MQRTAILALKGLLLALLLTLVACQVYIVPNFAGVTAAIYPDVAYLEIPGIITAVLFLCCVQIALLCVWRLLSLVAKDTIFSQRSYIYVDTILVLIVIATAVALAALFGLVALQIGTGSTQLICLLGVVLGAGSALLVVVLRGLITKAAELQQDLSEVV